MILEHEGKLSGHAGALYKADKRNSPITKGQHEFHQKCTDKILPSENKEAALQNALYSNLLHRVHPNDISRLNIDNIVTSRGYDLSDPSQRDRFILEYSLDYQKTFLAAKAVGVPKKDLNKIKPVSDDIKKHPYVKQVEKRINRHLDKHGRNKLDSKSIASFGKILMDPVPKKRMNKTYRGPSDSGEMDRVKKSKK